MVFYLYLFARNANHGVASGKGKNSTFRNSVDLTHELRNVITRLSTFFCDVAKKPSSGGHFRILTKSYVSALGDQQGVKGANPINTSIMTLYNSTLYIINLIQQISSKQRELYTLYYITI